MKRKTARRRVDVNVEELDRIIDDARTAPRTRGFPANACFLLDASRRPT